MVYPSKQTRTDISGSANKPVSRCASFYSPNKRSFRGPGGFVRGLDSLGGGQNLCMGTGPCGPPRGPPTTLVLGGRQKAVHPQLCPRGPPHGPQSPWSPWSPVARFWCHAWPLSGPRLFWSEGQFMGRFLARDCCLPLPRRFVAPKLP